MKILVIAAIPTELKAIKEGIKSAGIKENMNIDYLCCGIGNYETIYSLEQYLSKNPEETFIWNIGICGYWNLDNERKTDAIQVANIINIHTEKEIVIPPFLQIAPLKNCYCSENIIIKKPEFQKKIDTANNEMYFDMESRGIELVASKHKLPRLILKVPFDFIGENESVKEKTYKTIAEEVNCILKNLSYHEYLEKIIGWMDE